MLIGGLLKFSLIDYPGKVAAVVFTQGCNYRCPFCHNPELVLPELFTEPLAVDEVLGFLEKRRGQLQGVVITGGEPTLHEGLKAFIRRVKAMGYLVKLDTNGSRPQVLRGILDENLVDLIAMDIKASPAGYARATGGRGVLEDVRASIDLIKRSGIDHIFRTTALKGFLTPEDLAAIVALLGPVRKYKLQRGIVSDKILDRSLLDGPGGFSDEEWGRLQRALDANISVDSQS